jgi:hypothetical protein
MEPEQQCDSRFWCHTCNKEVQLKDSLCGECGDGFIEPITESQEHLDYHLVNPNPDPQPQQQPNFNNIFLPFQQLMRNMHNAAAGGGANVGGNANIGGANIGGGGRPGQVRFTSFYLGPNGFVMNPPVGGNAHPMNLPFDLKYVCISCFCLLLCVSVLKVIYLQ